MSEKTLTRTSNTEGGTDRHNLNFMANVLFLIGEQSAKKGRGYIGHEEGVVKTLLTSIWTPRLTLPHYSPTHDPGRRTHHPKTPESIYN